MIFPARAPLEPCGQPPRALYVSLNSPVVTVDGLPTGPAQAAVALHGRGATLCVRSVRSGQVEFFTTTEELAGDLRVALDAALSMAESLGFLFDEDEVALRGDAGPEEASLLWRELCGEEAPPAPPEEKPEAEILLDEQVVEEPVKRLPPALVLSKFRRAPGPEITPDRAAPTDVRLRLVSRF
ncbi:MAG: hypothetical protein ACQGVC_26610 [Myxococcota bacterium]